MKKSIPILFVAFAFALFASAEGAPSSYTFSGCGSPEVNGEYTLAGNFDSGNGNMPYFKNASGVFLVWTTDSYWSLLKDLNADGSNRYYRGIWRDPDVSSILTSTEWQVESIGAAPGCAVLGGASAGTTTSAEATAPVPQNSEEQNTAQGAAATTAGTPPTTIIVGTLALLIALAAWFGYKKIATPVKKEPTA